MDESAFSWSSAVLLIGSPCKVISPNSLRLRKLGRNPGRFRTAICILDWQSIGSPRAGALQRSRHEESAILGNNHRRCCRRLPDVPSRRRHGHDCCANRNQPRRIPGHRTANSVRLSRSGPHKPGLPAFDDLHSCQANHHCRGASRFCSYGCDQVSSRLPA
jgi:hypothetical protein